MAVTKIHRTSRITLYVSMLITIVVMAVFFIGGQVPEDQKIVAGESQPKFTDILLYWMYVLLIVTVVVWILFAIAGFFRKLKDNPKKGFSSLFGLLAFGGLLLVTYLMGSGEILNIPGYSGTENVPGVLKRTDMWLYSCYALLVVTLLSIIILPIFKIKK